MDGLVQGFGYGVFLIWFAVAAIWAGLAALAFRKWGRKALIWVALSAPLMVLFVFAATFGAVIALCSAAANGCIGY